MIFRMKIQVQWQLFQDNYRKFASLSAVSLQMANSYHLKIEKIPLLGEGQNVLELF